MSHSSLWPRYAEWFLRYSDLGFSIDISRMRFADDFFPGIISSMEKAFDDMDALEKGAISNPDEGRMVGHYWLRNSDLAPTPELRTEICSVIEDVWSFAREVHEGTIKPVEGKLFTHLLIAGIGGSALGPQFVSEALGGSDDKMTLHFLDNTDPDGFDRVFARLEGKLEETLVLVISKSGGTKETRNGMLFAEAAFTNAGIPFGAHAVAITGLGSDLDRHAVAGGWLKRFPMWDWVGGRTSVMSTVGLVPMALQGIDIHSFLSGASAMDGKTRTTDYRQNASMLLAAMWYFAGGGKGSKDMVILPYKDRLMLFSKYLQQLVMESLGKQLDLEGNVVNQGIAVYGNKGSTDQHAYVQQLRDGVPNFFATFIEVRKDRSVPDMEVEPGVTSGDYLQGFLRGTRTALYEGGRDSITLSVGDVNPYVVGALIALYERAVGFYASLVNINAYHQPGVEAGKKAATEVIALQASVVAALSAKTGEPVTAMEVAVSVGAEPEAVWHVLTHLAANHSSVEVKLGASVESDRFVRTH